MRVQKQANINYNIARELGNDLTQMMGTHVHVSTLVESLKVATLQVHVVPTY